jgi:hypothetical protein
MEDSIRIGQSAPGTPERRAERHLDAMLWYLFEYRTRTTETTAEQCERCVLSVNAFFDTEAFSVSYPSRDSLLIGCGCGWSLGLLLPEGPTPEAISALLARCLRRMVLHYEFQHDGLKKGGDSAMTAPCDTRRRRQPPISTG